MAMASAFLKKQCILSKCRHFIISGTSNYYKNNYHSIYKQISNNGAGAGAGAHQRRYYSRFSKRSAKDVHVPPFIVSGFSNSIARIRFVGWYLGMINSRPLLTKSITCSLIYVVADLTSQTIALPSSEPYDFIRTSRMAGYGLLILGPTLHYWFNFMSKVFPGRDLLPTAKKMTLGQTVYGPFMNVIFFSLNAALQGEDGAEILARLKRDLLPTMLNGLMYWPLCDFVTFRFAPVHLQPLVSNGFSYLWTVYMTYMASLGKASE